MDNSVFISRQGKINFVDLAGSEMTKKTQSEGKTLEEANNINKSLMVLGTYARECEIIAIVGTLCNVLPIWSVLLIESPILLRLRGNLPASIMQTHCSDRSVAIVRSASRKGRDFFSRRQCL